MTVAIARALTLAATALVAACQMDPYSSARLNSPTQAEFAATASADPVYVTDVENAAEREAFNRLVTEASATLRSERFHSNLRSLSNSYPAVYVHFLGSNAPGAERTSVTQTVDQLSAVVSGRAPYRFVRSPAYLVGTSSDDTARAGWTGTSEQLGSMTIGRSHLARWQSQDEVERSCAINTVAHEMTHLISNSPSIFMGHITDSFAATLTSVRSDGSPISPRHAVASYLIGTVAQCTWLQEKGYLPAVDLATCVQVFGDRGHNGLRCRSFSGSRAVINRSDLPAPYELLD
jgi:hypothetical protein